jgi:hypothetical protein
MHMMLCRLQATGSYVSMPVMRKTSSVVLPTLEAMIDQPLLRETTASDRPLTSRRSAKVTLSTARRYTTCYLQNTMVYMRYTTVTRYAQTRQLFASHYVV